MLVEHNKSKTPINADSVARREGQNYLQREFGNKGSVIEICSRHKNVRIGIVN